MRLNRDSVPTEAELEKAFLAADAQGNTEDAQVFATEIKKLRADEQHPLTPLGMGAARQKAELEAEAAAREAAEPYWILGGGVLAVVLLIVLWKVLKSRPWRLIPRAVRSAAKMKDKMMFDLSDQDAEWFAAAEEELVSGNIDKGTWARALVKAGGNEEKRKVDYITLRVKKMRLGE